MYRLNDRIWIMVVINRLVASVKPLMAVINVSVASITRPKAVIISEGVMIG